MSYQGVSYSQKFRGNQVFPNLTNSRTFQFVSQMLNGVAKFKIVKSKFKSEKIHKNKHKSNVVLKETEKRYQNRHDVCYVTLKHLFTFFTHTYL